MLELSPATVNEAPVDSDEPPVAAEYQLIVPKLAEALKVTALPLQNAAVVVPVITGTIFTNMVSPLEVAGEPATQGTLLVNTQFTTSPLCKVESVKTELFVPALFPLTFH